MHHWGICSLEILGDTVAANDGGSTWGTCKICPFHINTPALLQSLRLVHQFFSVWLYSPRIPMVYCSPISKRHSLFLLLCFFLFVFFHHDNHILVTFTTWSRGTERWGWVWQKDDGEKWDKMEKTLERVEEEEEEEWVSKGSRGRRRKHHRNSDRGGGGRLITGNEGGNILK